MCGIAGAIGSISDGVIEAVGRAHRGLQHRGPDAEGTWQHSRAQRGVALAHRRLAIIDLSADGAQPMRDIESGLTIVFNGEIYNFANLRTELEALGQVFQTRTDTEVLLKAHATWGDGAVERLNGMFAYALWDSNRRRTLLVRDRMGIKPLYLADSTFADRELCAAVGLESEAVGRLWRSYQQGAPGLYWSRVWSLFVLLNWCRRHGASL